MNVVRQTWNEKADEWAEFARNENNYWTQRMSAVAALASKHAPLGRALDVGCGPGLLCRLLAGAGFEVNGVDISENMIRKAKELLRDYVGDGEGRLYHNADGSLPFDPAKHQFRLITAVGVLEYIANRRFTRAGGLSDSRQYQQHLAFHNSLCRQPYSEVPAHEDVVRDDPEPCPDGHLERWSPGLYEG
jgi:predicted TPR repeat methyltransferase